MILEEIIEINGDEITFVLQKSNGELTIDEEPMEVSKITAISNKFGELISVELDIKDFDKIIIPGYTDIAKEYVKEKEKQEAADAMITMTRKTKLF